MRGKKEIGAEGKWAKAKGKAEVRVDEGRGAEVKG